MYGVHRVGVTIGLALVLAAATVNSVARAQARVTGNGNANANANGPGTTGSGGSDSLASVMRSMGSGPQTPVTVLMSPAVQKELKLTESQKGKIFNLSVAAMEKQRDHFQTMLLGGGGNPQAMLAARNALRQDNERAIAGILEPKQKERFDQIVLRAEGPLAVARPEVASKLNLNRNQNEYVQGIMGQLQRNQFMMYMRLRQGAATGQVGPAQLAQVRGMMSGLRQEAVNELRKIIDRKQQAAFDKLLGAPFDLARLDAEDGAEAAAPPAAERASEEAAAKDQDKDKDKATEKAEADPPASTKKSAKGASSARRKARSKSSSPASK